MVGFSGVLPADQIEDQKMIKKKQMEKIVSIFRGKLVKMIEDAGSKFDDYSVSPKIRQILFHWGYELTEKDVVMNLQNNIYK